MKFKKTIALLSAAFLLALTIVGTGVGGEGGVMPLDDWPPIIDIL